MKKKLLVVVDMQNDFIDGSLGSSQAQAIVDNVCKKIDGWNVSDPIIVTQDTHGSDYLCTLEGQNLPIKHCIDGTYGWCINSKVNDAMLSKPYQIVNIRKDTFGTPNIVDVVRKMAPDIVEVVGLCTDVCVISNAVIARSAMKDIKVIVDARCCAGITNESHKQALNAMKNCGIFVQNE